MAWGLEYEENGSFDGSLLFADLSEIHSMRKAEKQLVMYRIPFIQGLALGPNVCIYSNTTQSAGPAASAIDAGRCKCIQNDPSQTPCYAPYVPRLQSKF